MNAPRNNQGPYNADPYGGNLPGPNRKPKNGNRQQLRQNIQNNMMGGGIMGGNNLGPQSSGPGPRNNSLSAGPGMRPAQNVVPPPQQNWNNQGRNSPVRKNIPINNNSPNRMPNNRPPQNNNGYGQGPPPIHNNPYSQGPPPPSNNNPYGNQNGSYGAPAPNAGPNSYGQPPPPQKQNNPYGQPGPGGNSYGGQVPGSYASSQGSNGSLPGGLNPYNTGGNPYGQPHPQNNNNPYGLAPVVASTSQHQNASSYGLAPAIQNGVQNQNSNPYGQNAPPAAQNVSQHQNSNPYNPAVPPKNPSPYSQGSSNSYAGGQSQGSVDSNSRYNQPPISTNNPYVQNVGPLSPPTNIPYSGPVSRNNTGGPMAPQKTSGSQMSSNTFEGDLIRQSTGQQGSSGLQNQGQYNKGNYNNYDEAISLSLDGYSNNDGYYDTQQLAPARNEPPPKGYGNDAAKTAQSFQNSKGDPNRASYAAKKKVNTGPLNVEQFNNKRAAAERDDSPSVQLEWIKAIIEATQEPSLISAIDVTGSPFPTKLATSKEIRKNRDTFLHKGLKRLKRLVSKEYPAANYYLGTLYTNGKILEKNYDKAFDYYLKAAKAGDGEGMYRVAICYEMGVGTKQDDLKAFSWFQKSSQSHVIPGMFKLGMIYLKGTLQQRRSASQAIEWLELAAAEADENNPHALFELGKLYEGFYPISTEMSSLTKEDTIFLRDLRQIIPEMNDEKALNLYLRAAKLNYPAAQSKLGWCYEYGKLACPIDGKRSIGWYSKAASQGYALAEMALCGWYLTGAKGLLETNDKEAYLWARKAAEKGLSKAEYALGHFSETGLGTERDLVEAKKWYMRAAAQGHPKAIQRIQELNSMMK